MGNDPTDIWAWTHEDEKRFVEEGGPKKTMIGYYYEFWRQYHDDFDAANLAISQALDIARETGDARWQLHLRHWRLQLWLQQKNIRKALPEAVDLLTLATDERVRDVPQRICAYHDIVECYVEMDAAGYSDEIVENSQHILAQLPKRHPCATCARHHIADAAAASGRVKEAEQWIKLCEANLSEKRYVGLLTSFGDKYLTMEKWEEAECYFREAMELARKTENILEFIVAVLGVARAKVGNGQLQEAIPLLDNVKGNLKYRGAASHLARLLEVEGHLTLGLNNPSPGAKTLVRSARINLELGSYRAAALSALKAAEEARRAELPANEVEEALEIAARAVGYMPPASRDVYARLETLGRAPVEPPLEGPGVAELSPEEEEQQQARKERRALEEMFEQNVALGDANGAAGMLFRLSRWHYEHDARRAAVDYLIWNAALERWLRLPLERREDAVGALKNIREHMPAGAIESALETAAAAIPEPLKLLLEQQVPLARWAWLVRCVGQEVRGEPVVEAEPEPEKSENGFNDWLEYNATTVALILRFFERVDEQEREHWASTYDLRRAELAKQKEEHPEPEAQRELTILDSLMQSLAALSRNVPIEEVRTMALPPFDNIINQIEAVAQLQVWEMPGLGPLDLLVEQMARDVVRALSLEDEYRTRRLPNLAFRLRLIQYDLLEVEELRPIARFLEALRELVLSEGRQLPELNPPLEAPFDGLLAATFKASQGRVSQQDAEQPEG